MKRFILISLMVVATLVAGLAPPALAQEPGKQIPVLVDGQPVTFDAPPVIQDKRILVPFRAIAEALNVQVDWDGNTRTVRATDGKTSIRLQVGDRTAYRNNAPRGAQLQIVRDRFTRFAKLLSSQLQAAGLHLTLTLHAPNSVYKGYDYKGLGAIADRIIIMAYDYGAIPEPVSKVEEAVQMARVVVPPSKLVLGISAPTETATSILGKVGIAKRYNLGGIALWRLGLVSDAMWEALRTSVVTRRL
ncbi:stalk domain-containing protein [Moorella naiadis]|uniref:stalk domain-containing protein n=1 Tax=Moorella naiadis (nom. illeg.) TaxID=3093670 RepID=UPI003D9C94D1